MSIYVFALLIGMLAGLRAITPLAAVSWAAYLGLLPLEHTWLAFLGYTYAPYILSLFAIGELIADKLPKTPSRKKPMPFIARLVPGAVCGAAFGLPHDVLAGGLLAGMAGSVIGALAGYELRVRLTAAAGGRDLPIALLEDVIAIGGAILITVIVGTSSVAF
jgi:uncharacterized membrane protein